MRSDSRKVSSSFQNSITARSSAGKSAREPTGSKIRLEVSTLSPENKKDSSSFSGTSLSDPRYHPASQGHHPGHSGSGSGVISCLAACRPDLSTPGSLYGGRRGDYPSPSAP